MPKRLISRYWEYEDYEPAQLSATEVIEEHKEPSIGLLDAEGNPIFRELPRLGFDMRGK